MLRTKLHAAHISYGCMHDYFSVGKCAWTCMEDTLPPYIASWDEAAHNWANGDLRLAGTNHTAYAGRLEIYIEGGYDSAGHVELGGEWGTVCGNKFSLREANVACRQLGYQSADMWAYTAYTT